MELKDQLLMTVELLQALEQCKATLAEELDTMTIAYNEVSEKWQVGAINIIFKISDDPVKGETIVI